MFHNMFPIIAAFVLINPLGMCFPANFADVAADASANYATPIITLPDGSNYTKQISGNTTILTPLHDVPATTMHDANQFLVSVIQYESASAPDDYTCATLQGEMWEYEISLGGYLFLTGGNVFNTLAARGDIIEGNQVLAYGYNTQDVNGIFIPCGDIIGTYTTNDLNSWCTFMSNCQIQTSGQRGCDCMNLRPN